MTVIHAVEFWEQTAITVNITGMLCAAISDSIVYGFVLADMLIELWVTLVSACGPFQIELHAELIKEHCPTSIIHQN